MRKQIIKGKSEQYQIRITLALPILYIWHIIITLQCIAGAKHKSINQSLLINKRYNWMISIYISLLQSEKHIIKGKREQNSDKNYTGITNIVHMTYYNYFMYIQSLSFLLLATWTFVYNGRFLRLLEKEGFEDTKRVIRISKSKDRQHNDQMKKDKRTNSDLQNIHIKLKE